MDDDAHPRKWTIDNIGQALKSHTEREKVMEATTEELKKKVDKIYTILIEGNGEPSIRETVRNHQSWIDGVNKLMWIFITAAVGQIVVGGCALLVALIVLLRGGTP